MPNARYALTRLIATLALVLSLAGAGLAPAEASAAPAHADALALDEATIADINAAFASRKLTSERLVRMYLERIEAYDKQGPAINSVLTLNPKALQTARELDAERRKQGPRSKLHGIPVLLKDNFDTFDLPTTAGSLLLEGSIPPDDAYVVRRLREAGAVILGKVNMSEFAYGDAHSSLGGRILNPHDPARSPSGSSGGTAAAIAAAFASVGLGTDTSGSVRDPAAVTGIVGLRPTLGLLSRDGIIPLALSFDTPGPMTRSVYDAAVTLEAMTGVDPADPATQASAGKVPADYTSALTGKALAGARIGVARQFMGGDGDVDWVVEVALRTMADAGATLVEVKIPTWLVDSTRSFDRAMHFPEFKLQIEQYLATTGPTYPKTLADLLARAEKIAVPRADGAGPSPWRWGMFKAEAASGSTQDYDYLAVRDHGVPMVRAVIEGLMAKHGLDAVVYPTSSAPAWTWLPHESRGAKVSSPILLSSVSGFPELSVPAGFTSGRLPVGISFLGLRFTESRLLALGHSFEQLQHARRLPRYTPLLPGESIERR